MKRILTILLAAALLLGVLPTASAENLTAQQEAVVQTAIAYYLKNPYVQYDSVVITKRGVGDGGVQRNSDRATPEDATADRTVYAVCSSFACMVYLNALGYDMGGGGSFPPTAAMFNMTGDIVVMKYEAGGDMTAAEATQKVQSLVQPGDIFVVRRTTNTGHAMVYVGDIDGDGKGELLHSTTTGGGGKFDMEKGEDKIEPNGAIHNDDAFDTRMSEKELSGDNISGFILLRPLAAGAKNCAPTEAAAQRVKYPWFAYERTVSCGFYGSPATGDDLTYTIKLTNKSTGAYTVPVTETVPDGTALKDAPDAQVSGGKLSWSVPLAAGESKTVSYTVTVTAPRGTVITAGGGTAAGIESNVLRNRVSGKQPDAAKLQNKDAWADAVIAEAPDGLEIADAIYRHALGVDLKLTDAKALLEPCFKIVSDNDMLRSEQISTAAGDGNAMIVDGFLGGKLILTPADERVLEL
ncbi:MAG: DUF11 domain-containing protein, partial [Oscillospiraceae bacterium]|nr:DUF11 domain-containing protein [Oscillospiraceae bacterium]